MPDLVYCLVIVGFFVIAWMMVQACERLEENQNGISFRGF